MFRFSIREIVLVTVSVAVGMGWWADRAQLLDANRSLERQMQALDAKWNATFENERRIANLRAMEAWGRVDSRWRTPAQTRGP
jgi:hypothetical protein